MKRAIRNFLWPTYTASEPRLLQRIGRVLHWSIVATTPLLFFVVQGGMGDVALALFVSTLVVVTGRAVRYILSAE